MKLFEPNIDSRGRAIRAAGATAFAVGAALSWPASRLLTVFLSLASAFMFFEAARGWCAVRACGIKTPL